ncbi:glycosyltransferase family 4 protein [Patescibacteria group bacterium]|nr:glycosyltransferase family 4 protein [Patescibacteria group bacterium]
MEKVEQKIISNGVIDLKDISILMISFDTGLLNSSSSGDSISRHREYAKSLKRLDIIVLGKTNNSGSILSDNLQVYGVGNKFLSLYQAWVLAKDLMKKNKYDLVDTQDPHLTGLLGMFLKKKYKIKFELHFHGDFWDNPRWLALSFKHRIFNILQKKTVKNADAIRVVNKKIKEKLVFSGINESKIQVINTPVDTEKFVLDLDNQQISDIKNKYSNKKIILFVGRLVPEKNLTFLLELIKELKEKRNNFVLLLVGEGTEHDKLINFVNQNDLQDLVFFLGAKEHNELLVYYQAAYLSILLSVSESFGKVIIESGLSATPTLASRSLGPSAIIEDGQNGWLVDINDLENTTAKLVYLLDNEDLVKLIGIKIKQEFADTYSRGRTFGQVKDFWFKIVNNQL